MSIVARQQRNSNDFVYPKREIYLLLPAFLGFAAFYLLPVEYIFRSAFWKSTFDHTFAGLDNFQQVIQNNYFQTACINMFVLMFGMIILVFILSVPISVFIRENREHLWLHGILLLSVFIPSAALGSAWLILPTFFNTALEKLLTLGTWKTLGISISVLLVGYASLDPHAEEASLIDGVSFLQRYWYIVFPQMVPSMLFSLIYTAVQSQRLYREAYILFGEYPSSDVYLLQHYMNHHFRKLNYPLLSSAALIELAMIIALFYAGYLVWRKRKQ